MGAASGPWLATEFVVCRSRDIAVSVADAHVYTTGMSFRVMVRFREGTEPPGDVVTAFEEFSRGRSARTGGLVVSVRLSGVGVGGRPSRREATPHLTVLGGAGSLERGWDVQHWMWPLPHDSGVIFSAEWPDAGIARGEFDLESLYIVKGRAQIERLFEQE